MYKINLFLVSCLFVSVVVVCQKNFVGFAEAWETQEPQQQIPTEHNGGSYRAFVTSIQHPINISEAYYNRRFRHIYECLALMEIYWL